MNSDRDPVFERLSKFSDPAFALLAEYAFDQLPEREKTFICVWSLVGEVDNGGFDQFFFNSSGDYAYATPDALRRIGANDAANIVELSIRLFGPEGPPAELECRRQQMVDFPPEIDESFNQLDDEFYRCSDYVRISDLLLRYIDQ